MQRENCPAKTCLNKSTMHADKIPQKVIVQNGN